MTLPSAFPVMTCAPDAGHFLGREHRLPVRVYYEDTDATGLVYHANYLPWCEIGRTDLIRRLYKPYAEVEKDGVLLAVTEVGLRYHASARYDELVRVTTTLEQVRSRAVEFAYLIERVEADGGTTRPGSPTPPA